MVDRTGNFFADGTNFPLIAKVNRILRNVVQHFGNKKILTSVEITLKLAKYWDILGGLFSL